MNLIAFNHGHLTDIRKAHDIYATINTVHNMNNSVFKGSQMIRKNMRVLQVATHSRNSAHSNCDRKGKRMFGSFAGFDISMRLPKKTTSKRIGRQSV